MAVSISQKNREFRNSLSGFDQRIDKMHLDFMKYRTEELLKMPEWEKLERELLVFSRQRIFDMELSRHLDRILFKFQTRKKIWLAWVDEVHRAP